MSQYSGPNLGYEGKAAYYVISNEEQETEKPTSPGLQQPVLSPEEDKPVLQRFPHIGSYLIHLIALAFTGVILQINFRNIYWADENNWDQNKWSLGLSQTETQNVLQFPAKLHEIFVVSSLSVIIFGVIRSRLIGDQGVPFGFLIGGYQAGSAEYFFSKGYWGPLGSAIRRRKAGTIGVGLMIGLGIIYANVVGPCSAGLIIPNLDWWPVSNPFNGQPFTVYVNGALDTLYPQTLDDVAAENYVPECFTAPITQICPGGGNDDLRNYANALGSDGISPTLSIPLFYSTARRNLSAFVNTSMPSGDSIAIASTLQSDITDVTGLFWHWVSTKNESGLVYDISRPQFQPNSVANTRSAVAQAQCTYYDLYTSIENDYELLFPTDLLVKLSGSNTTVAPIVPDQYWKFDHKEYNATNFTWVDMSEITWPGQSFSASIAAVITVPYLVSHDDGNYTTQESIVIPCIMDARWATAKVTFDPVSDDEVTTNITDNSVFQNAPQDPAVRANYGVGAGITITSEWAQMLDVPGILADDKTFDVINTTAMSSLFYQFVSSGIQPLVPHGGNASDAVADQVSRYFEPPHWNASLTGGSNSLGSATSETISTLLSLALADGVSRASYEFYSYFMVTDDSNPANFTLISLLTQAGQSDIPNIYLSQNEIDQEDLATLTYTVQRYGWSYGTQTKTAKFSVAVLMVHAAIAVAYIFYTVLLSLLPVGRWRSGAWEDVGELVALAMLSSEPRALKGAGAGIDTWATWKLNFMVRERPAEDGRLELVVGDREGGPASGPSRQVRPRVKYS
ncbi:hypothetical protein BX600DRAFT_157861 [Xylariales sp. PMI_506]|nr:hypothetical protein BX600DRAFT_157861 [Xylariales sp. PMI_506]